ncbi:MAG: protein kinase [Polyangiaceae bacterium]|nr:protein kinase [Polyangiaceae bacterium]
MTTPPVKNMRPQVGQLINNKYRLSRMLGDGGMGSVFEAQHEVLGKAVALKFLHPELARRQGLVQRFLQEARVSATIDSRHVVKVTDVEQTPTGLPFMVMEFLKGKSLQALYEDNYREGKRLGYEDALKYAVQMLDGLEAAHEEGVVHRDLKPDNVMIVHGKRNEPIVKLLDFGIAKLKINGELYKGLTRPGVIMGTPEYMAPEQVFSADAVDGRADIFSCGVMIFEMLAGRRPVGGDEAHQIAAAYLSGNIARLTELAPHVPAGLAEIVHKAMSPDPKDRYATVADFKLAMEPFTKGVSKLSNTTPPPNVTPSLESSQPNMAALVAPAVSPAPMAKSIPGADGGVVVGPELAGTVGAKSPDGWSVDGAARSSKLDGAATDKMSHPYVGEDIASISAKLKAAAGGKEQVKFDSTVEGQPFFPGSTAAYQAPTSNPPPAHDNISPKTSAMPQMAALQAGAIRPGGTDIGGAVMPATASYDSAPRPAYPVVPTPAYTPARRRKKSGIGFGSILIIGSLVAGAVVAGVYAFEHSSKTSTKEESKTVALPSKPTTTQPVTQNSVVTNPQPTQPVYTPPTITQTNTTPTQPKPTTTGPRPTAPKPSASNTNTPPILPSSLPGIPSSFPPFDLPFPGMGKPTSNQPQDPPPKKPGRPGLEPIPQGNLEPAPMQPQNNQPQTQPETKPKPVERPTHASTRPRDRFPEILRPSKPATSSQARDTNAKTVDQPRKTSSRVVPVGARINAPKH